MTKVLFILALILVSDSSAAQQIALQLAPDSATLPVAGATPALHEKVPEAIHPKDGLMICPEKPFEWAYPDSRKEPIRFSIDSDDGIFEHVVLTIWNWHNRPVFREQLSAGATHQLDLRVEGRGVYQFTLEGYRGGECRKRLVRSFAVTEDLGYAREIWKTDEFLLGICAFPGRYHWSYEGGSVIPDGIYPHAARNLEAELMAKLGFQVVRIDESMEMGRRDDGYIFNFKRMDGAVEAYTSRGLKLALQLMHAPDWAVHSKYSNEEKGIWRYPREEIHQRSYIKALLERYGKHTKFVQVFNEPDQKLFWAGKPEEYVEQYLYSLNEIRKYSTVPVLNGGYSLFEKEKTQFYVDRLQGHIDMAAWHCHGDLRELIGDFTYVRGLHEKAGYSGIRFMNTEMGFDGWRLDQELRKGQFVPQKALYCWASGHAGALLFGSRMTMGPARRTQDFGFLDHYFCPRYVYGSVAAMVSALAGAVFDSVLVADDDLFVYQFRRDDQIIIAAFTLNQSADLNIDSGSAKVVRIDEMGNRRPFEGSGPVSLSLTNYPVYLEVTGTAEVKVTRK